MQIAFKVLLSASFLFLPAYAGDLTGTSLLSTAAGTSWVFAADGAPAVIAPLSTITFLALDNSGGVVFADTGNHVVSRLNADGTLTVLAGNGIRGFSGDGQAARTASLNAPFSAVVDRAGNLFIYDGNARIRKVTPDGIISTYAGTRTTGSHRTPPPPSPPSFQPQST